MTRARFAGKQQKQALQVSFIPLKRTSKCWWRIATITDTVEATPLRSRSAITPLTRNLLRNDLQYRLWRLSQVHPSYVSHNEVGRFVRDVERYQFRMKRHSNPVRQRGTTYRGQNRAVRYKRSHRGGGGGGRWWSILDSSEEYLSKCSPASYEEILFQFIVYELNFRETNNIFYTDLYLDIPVLKRNFELIPQLQPSRKRQPRIMDKQILVHWRQLPFPYSIKHQLYINIHYQNIKTLLEMYFAWMPEQQT